MTTESINSSLESPEKTQAADHLFEAEVEYVLDELQKKAYRLFGEDAGTLPACDAEIGFRLADITPQGKPGHYWLRDMGVIVMQIMSVMETHGYKLSEEILEIVAIAEEEKGSFTGVAPEKELAS